MKKLIVLLLAAAAFLVWLSPHGCVPETCWRTGVNILFVIALLVGGAATVALYGIRNDIRHRLDSRP